MFKFRFPLQKIEDFRFPPCKNWPFLLSAKSPLPKHDYTSEREQKNLFYLISKTCFELVERCYRRTRDFRWTLNYEEVCRSCFLSTKMWLDNSSMDHEVLFLLTNYIFACDTSQLCLIQWGFYCANHSRMYTMLSFARSTVRRRDRNSNLRVGNRRT